MTGHRQGITEHQIPRNAFPVVSSDITRHVMYVKHTRIGLDAMNSEQRTHMLDEGRDHLQANAIFSTKGAAFFEKTGSSRGRVGPSLGKGHRLEGHLNRLKLGKRSTYLNGRRGYAPSIFSTGIHARLPKGHCPPTHLCHDSSVDGRISKNSWSLAGKLFFNRHSSRSSRPFSKRHSDITDPAAVEWRVFRV